MLKPIFQENGIKNHTRKIILLCQAALPKLELTSYILNARYILPNTHYSFSCIKYFEIITK